MCCSKNLINTLRRTGEWNRGSDRRVTMGGVWKSWLCGVGRSLCATLAHPCQRNTELRCKMHDGMQQFGRNPFISSFKRFLKDSFWHVAVQQQSQTRICVGSTDLKLQVSSQLRWLPLTRRRRQHFGPPRMRMDVGSLKAANSIARCVGLPCGPTLTLI